MSERPAPRPSPHERPPAEDAGTGVPGFRTWRGVYLFVVVCFAIYVAVFAWLTATFNR